MCLIFILIKRRIQSVNIRIGYYEKKSIFKKIHTRNLAIEMKTNNNCIWIKWENVISEEKDSQLNYTYEKIINNVVSKIKRWKK